MKIDSLSRKQVRYWLFRKQNEVNGGSKAKGAPKGLFGRFEDQAVFQLAGGYKNFGVTWDIDRSDKFTIVARSKSIQDEWNDHLEQFAKPIPEEVC